MRGAIGRVPAVGLALVVALSTMVPGTARAEGVLYDGTVFISSDVLTPASPSDFMSLTYVGTSNKRTFDRRVNAWINASSHVFVATYECALRNVDVVVNAEIARQEAEFQAGRFARILGQLPFGSRKAVRELWVHPGDELAGGGNGSILVYTGYADKNAPFLEEVFVHEAAHTSLDWTFGGAVNHEGWRSAADADGRFISQYAKDNPEREDVAESYGAFLVHDAAQTNGALRDQAERIGYAIPNRMAYFRSLGSEFGVSRASCPDYSAASQPVEPEASAAERRVPVVAKRGKGVKILKGTFLSEDNILQATLGTKLKKGTEVRILLGNSERTGALERTVDRRGNIDVRVDVTAVRDVRVVDERNRLILRWRIRG